MTYNCIISIKIYVNLANVMIISLQIFLFDEQIKGCLKLEGRDNYKVAMPLYQCFYIVQRIYFIYSQLTSSLRPAQVAKVCQTH